ncbi:LmeA family phospholipid-binding protein [Micromonospora wenchangensis]|uniref:LmeA family phospholipid-binding protein n=1 Tax=Micromonospora wenchangensis TaxID=1185415 RepID=UPI003D74CC03
MQRNWIIAGAPVVLLLGLGFTADRVVADRAADRLAARLQCTAGLSEPPEADFGVGPFLIQSALGTFSTVHVRVPQVTVGRFSAAVDATAHDVRLPGSGEISAGSVTADVTLPYDQLGTAAAAHDSPGATSPAGYGADDAGRLTVQMQIPLLGGSRQVTVYADPEIVDGVLRIEPEEVEIPFLGIRLPASRLGDKARSRTVELPTLPAGLVYEGAAATADGLRLTITGNDIRPAGSSSGKACR